MSRLDVSFRPAAEADWPSIWPIISATLAGGDTYPYLRTTTNAEARGFWMTDPASRRVAFVAESDRQVVATAYLKPNLPGLGDHVANAGWLVDRAFRGLGIGRSFAIYVMDEARRSGYTGMQFNAVVSTNEAAISLWRSLGFEVVGTVPAAFRHQRDGIVPVHIMYRAL